MAAGLMKSGGQRLVTALVSTMAPYLPPWLVAGATYGAATLTHQAWGSSPGPVLAAAAVSGVLTWGTSKVSPGGPPLWRGHATVTCALGTGAVPLSAAIDPGAPGALSAWAILGGATALSWNIRKMVRNGGSGDRKELPASGSDLLDAIARLKGTKIGATAIDGHQVTATLELPPGEVTVDDVQGSRANIASLLGVHKRAIRVQEDPERGDRAHLTIVPKDMLAASVPWPGPSKPGGCITDPIVYGIYEDGKPAAFWLPGDTGRTGAPRPASHVLYSGATGAGKGETFINVIAELATRRRVAMWVADPAKGSQTLQDVADAFEWVALGEAHTKALLACLPAVITARANQLGKWGFKQWEPRVYDEHGMPYLYVHIEEASRVLGGNSAWVKASQEARSAGMSLGASAQVFDHTTIPRKTRGQFAIGLVHGQGEDIDASYVLPDEVIEAGGDPVRWGNKQPGMNLLVAPGVPEDRWAIPARSYLSDPEKVRKTVAAYAGLRAVSDPVTAAAAGAAFANRHSTGTTLRDSVTEARREEAVSQDTAVHVYDDDEDDVNQVIAYQPPAAVEDLGDVDINQAVPPTTPDGPSFVFGQPDPQKPTRAAAVATLEQRIEDLRIEGRQAFAPADLKDVLTVVRRKRGWLMGELATLVNEGRLFRVDEGVYQWTDRWRDASALVSAT